MGDQISVRVNVSRDLYDFAQRIAENRAAENGKQPRISAGITELLEAGAYLLKHWEDISPGGSVSLMLVRKSARGYLLSFYPEGAVDIGGRPFRTERHRQLDDVFLSWPGFRWRVPDEEEGFPGDVLLVGEWRLRLAGRPA